MGNETPKQCVAVIGAATAGAEVASRLAQRGILVVVFDQNPRPFGKIEDGLPRWHAGLRRKEYGNITEKLSHPLVRFVPNTRVGADVDFEELVEGWGFAAVVLANGAWRDRPLPVEGAEEYLGKGLVYQNPFVIAFNHQEDPSYEGPTFEIRDGTMVVGGGLASIDVAKIITLSCTRDALAKRGIEVDITELEVKGIPKTLAAHDLSWEDLGLEGCTIYYRRSIEDMPLVSIPDGATPERTLKIRRSRGTVAGKAMDKFMLKIETLSAPDGLIVEDGQLVGLRFRRTRIEDGRVVLTDDTYEARGTEVISSIGSIPEPIPGIDMKGELFDFTDWDYGRLARYPSVFSVGNVVTGKGNIVASRKHATHVSHDAIEAYLGVADPDSTAEAPIPGSEEAARVAESVAQHAESRTPIDAATLADIEARVSGLQERVGYANDLEAWLESVGKPC
jgi:NADPH-dependent glutamate synthase beta subunit-like oxidoreductase